MNKTWVIKHFLFTAILSIFSLNANAILCFTSKAKLAKIPKMLEDNFYFKDIQSIEPGPQFGLKKRKLKKTINLIKNCNRKIDELGLSQCLSKDILPVLEVAYKKLKASSHSGFSNSLAFEVKDKEYFKSIPKGATSLPKELQDGLPENWRELVDQNENWTGLEYLSRTVANPPGPNRSRGRVLLQVNDPPYERWIQFTIPQPCRSGEWINTENAQAYCDKNGKYRILPAGFSGTPSEVKLATLPEYKKQERLVDYISVNTEAVPNKIYFTQYWRDENGKNPVRRDKAHGQGRFDTCFTCHPNGMRQLSPTPGSVQSRDLSALEQMKSKISGYNNLDWGVAITPKGYGPHLGEKQNCTSCHNNRVTGRGAINYMTEPSHIEHKLHGDFSMNPVYRTQEQKFLSDMTEISRYISEEDRQEIQRIIQRANGEFSSRSYDLILDYIQDKNLNVPFSVDVYRKTLERIRKRNDRFSVAEIRADIGTQFKKVLFSNCRKEDLPDYPLPQNINNENETEVFSIEELMDQDQEQGPVHAE